MNYEGSRRRRFWVESSIIAIVVGIAVFALGLSLAMLVQSNFMEVRLVGLEEDVVRAVEIRQLEFEVQQLRGEVRQLEEAFARHASP